jgi:hypothetical protein
MIEDGDGEIWISVDPKPPHRGSPSSKMILLSMILPKEPQPKELLAKRLVSRRSTQVNPPLTPPAINHERVS